MKRTARSQGAIVYADHLLLIRHIHLADRITRLLRDRLRIVLGYAP